MPTMQKEYALWAAEKTEELLSIDSPTGYTRDAAEWTRKAFSELGFKAWLTERGGVYVDLGGETDKDGILLTAHIDTLGAIVAEVKPDGRLRLAALNGLQANNCEAENARLHTRGGRVYTGCFQLINASSHVNTSYAETQRTFDTMEFLLDENVQSAADVRALGIEVGDIVAFDPRAVITPSGYIKSRYLDDKLSVGIILALAKYLKDNGLTPKHRTYCHFTVFEEVGYGAPGALPEGVTEALGVDMGCVGKGLQCTERQVSICAKDSGGPYHYDLVTKLVDAAKKEGADFVLDVYPRYSSDLRGVLMSGNDVRHGLIGAGVYASHRYVRSHIDGVLGTLQVLKGYLEV